MSCHLFQARLTREGLGNRFCRCCSIPFDVNCCVPDQRWNAIMTFECENICGGLIESDDPRLNGLHSAIGDRERQAPRPDSFAHTCCFYILLILGF